MLIQPMKKLTMDATWFSNLIHAPQTQRWPWKGKFHLKLQLDCTLRAGASFEVLGVTITEAREMICQKLNSYETTMWERNRKRSKHNMPTATPSLSISHWHHPKFNF